MKPSTIRNAVPPSIAVAVLLSQISASAMRGLEYSVQLDPWAWSDGFDNEVQSDPPGSEDNTTVTGKLEPLNLGLRYDFQLKHQLTGSLDLTVGLDLRVGLNYSALFQTFDPSFQKLDHTFIQGGNLDRFIIDYNSQAGFPTIEVQAEPVVPAKTSSHNLMDYSGGSGMRFNYVFPSQEDHGKTLVVTDAFLDDIQPAKHPSSQQLWGLAFCANGHEMNPITFQVVMSQSYLDRGGLNFEDIRGYIDGQVPTENFEFNYLGLTTDLGMEVDFGTDRLDERYGVFSLRYENWSPHDVQIGVFLVVEPLRFTGIELEAGGVRLFWNADTNQTYTLESFSELGGATNTVATGLTGPSFLDTTLGDDAARYYRLRED